MPGAPIARGISDFFGHATNPTVTGVLPAIERLRGTDQPRVDARSEFIGYANIVPFDLAQTSEGLQPWRLPGAASQKFDLRVTVSGTIPVDQRLFLKVAGVLFSKTAETGTGPVGVTGHDVAFGGDLINLAVGWQYGEGTHTLTLKYSATIT